jgi:hypothetical protein
MYNVYRSSQTTLPLQHHGNHLWCGFLSYSTYLLILDCFFAIVEQVVTQVLFLLENILKLMLLDREGRESR